MNQHEKSDARPLRLSESGDAAAFDAVVLRFQGRVLRLACVWLYDGQLAADVAQEIFVRGYQRLYSFRF